jgi:hypothetical protein
LASDYRLREERFAAWSQESGADWLAFTVPAAIEEDRVGTPKTALDAPVGMAVAMAMAMAMATMVTTVYPGARSR